MFIARLLHKSGESTNYIKQFRKRWRDVKSVYLFGALSGPCPEFGTVSGLGGCDWDGIKANISEGGHVLLLQLGLLEIW
ncbi:hypothetical protein Pmani_004162 [Petrolisthes manimaculis]|uniref:Uncharacterized protein n=1 Tax=Petrolisthes manimaculis TaxID=1843537 RepID=A0AAE1UIQ9_9EUCA|nr:hypothetical protein Pmani_004162 [Petrolisthes manimaculis]